VGVGREVSAAMKRFSIMSLNLRFGLADDGPNDWQFRKKALPLLFDTYQPDFICFQEANDFQVDFLHEILRRRGMVGRRQPAPPFWQSNVIFHPNEWVCRYSDLFFLSPTPTVPSRFRQSRWPRQAVVARFRNATRSLTVVNTHFDFAVEVRIRSARLIMELLTTVPTSDPVIITGDFNAAPGSPCYNLLTGKQPHEAPGPFFRDPFDATFPGTQHGFTGTAKSARIDWILFRGPLHPLERRIVQERFEGMYPSDHFPVLAHFEWKEEGAWADCKGDDRPEPCSRQPQLAQKGFSGTV